MTQTANLQITKPTPLDPATNNVWGPVINTDFDIIDAAMAGILTFPVSTGTYTLQNIGGQTSQAINRRFVFTGTLVADVTVLWPQAYDRFFSAVNQTTGAFNLILGVDNGSGAPAGTTVLLPVGNAGSLFSDGVNLAYDTVPQEVPDTTAGTTYTVKDSDRSTLTTFNNAGATAVTVPVPTATALAAGWWADYENRGDFIVTFTPTIPALIDGKATFTIKRNDGFRLVSDGTNFFTVRGVGAMGKQETVASSGTTDLGATGSNNVLVNGTTTITGFGNNASVDYPLYVVSFSGILMLTNSSSLVLPGGANITTGAGDTSLWLFAGSSKWVCIAYQSAAHAPGGGALLNIQTFSTPGANTYTPTPGTTSIRVTLGGGGGSGASAAATTTGNVSIGSGGSAGAVCQSRFTTGIAVTTVTIGAGGAAPAAGFNNGNAGGNSTFGVLMTAPGGFGGFSANSTPPPTAIAGGAPSSVSSGGNLYNATGEGGGNAIGSGLGATFAGDGGSSRFGGGGAGGFGPSGSSIGGNAGNAASSPCAAGGGAVSANGGGAFAAGAGANGICIIEEFS